MNIKYVEGVGWCEWDPKKSTWLKNNPKRKCSFEEAAQIFKSNYYDGSNNEFLHKTLL